MITNGEGYHYLTVKETISVIKMITSKHHGDICCLSCLHSFATGNKHESDLKIKIFVTL